MQEKNLLYYFFLHKKLLRVYCKYLIKINSLAALKKHFDCIYLILKPAFKSVMKNFQEKIGGGGFNISFSNL